MNNSIRALKSFGPLFHLTLSVNDLFFHDFPSGKVFHFNLVTNDLNILKSTHVSVVKLSIQKNGHRFGELSVGEILDAEESAVFEKLVSELGEKIYLLELSGRGEFYEAILNKLHEGIVACDENGILQFFNKKSMEIHGLPGKQIPADSWSETYDIFAKDGIHRLEMKDLPLFRALQGEKIEGAEIVIAPPGKEKVSVISYADVLLNQEADKIGAFASMRDESQLTKELEKVDSRFKTIFYQSPLSIQICSPDGKTVLVNPAWKELWGIPEEVIQNFILKEYNMLEDPRLEEQGVMKFIKKGYSGETTKIPVIRYDAKQAGLKGRERYVEGLVYPLKDRFNKVTEVVLIHIDVTDKKKLEHSQSFLNNVSSVMNTSLEYEKTISQIADACVPGFADACLINLVEGNKLSRIIGRFKNSLIETQLSAGPDDLEKEVMNTGRPFLSSNLIVVPMTIRAHVIGTIKLAMSSDDLMFDELGHETALELAKRAGFAIENSQLYRQLQEAIRLRDEFISLASHELKTPITSMKLQFQMFEKDPDASKISKVVQTSNKQLNRINRLVDDILDISRLSTGKLSMHFEKCNLNTIVQDVIRQLSLEYENVRKNLELKVSGNIDAVCDQLRIEQVISNLVTNASRYGEGKPIEVALSEKDGVISIKVSDQGPGISRDDQERVFGKFERASSINISGLGLGLYISRNIMDQHHGTLKLESSNGHGAVFTASFPSGL